MSSLYGAWTVLENAGRLFWYLIRGGQKDALDRIAQYDEMFAQIDALGADRAEALRNGGMLAAVGVDLDQMNALVKTLASGQLCEYDRQDLGIAVRLIVHDRYLTPLPSTNEHVLDLPAYRPSEDE